VKVIDWGLGFFFGGMARMKSAVGSLAYAAPEVIEAEETSSYTEACDLWSLGAMSYVMLCGRPPFWGSVAGQLSKMHAETYPMTAAPWPSVSTEAKDFIRCLLRADPRNRLPIASAIDHAWLRNFRESQTVSKEAVSSVLWNMEKSSNNSKFLSVCLASAARQMDVKNFEGIREVFQNLDANHDGTLDMEELRNGMAKIYGMDSEQAQNVAAMFTRLDLDENGMVDYTEFMVAALSDKMLEQEHILWTAFKSFDVHGDDGKITKEDIKEVLSKANVREAWTPEVCDQVAAEVLRMFDQDGRGYLDFEAWLRMMRTVAWPSEEDESPRMPSRAFSASSSSEATRSAVSWISLDPRTGQILAYPSEIAKTIEAHWQMKRSSVELGTMFHNARIVFSGNKDGHPFQRTPNGLRDVRRIEVLPEMVEIEIFLTGSAGEFRFAVDGAGRKQLTSGLAKNSIDPQEALESYWKSRESTSMDTGASWSLTEFGVSLNDTMGTVGKFLWGSRQEESTRRKTSL
jgi:Ca2+-binding EF-hand superfamily protein